MQSVSPVRGVLLMLGSSLAFCLMCAIVRLSNANATMVALFRFVIGMAILGSAAIFGRIRLQFSNGRFLFLRGFTGGIAVYLFYLSISTLGLGKGTVISYMYPVFAAVFGRIILKETVGLLRSLYVVTALVGVMLLTVDRNVEVAAALPQGGQGVLEFLRCLPDHLKRYLGKYEALALTGAALSGLAVVFVKKLHDTDSTYAIFFSQCIFGAWIIVVPANVAASPLTYAQGFALVGVGVAAAVGQLLMTEGYRHVTVTTGSLLGMLVPVLNLVVAFLFFSERLSLRAMVGSAVVVLSCLLLVTGERAPRPGSAKVSRRRPVTRPQ